MKPVLEKLILKKFRSIVVEEITFDNPTFFLGRNGSGKSNIADAFAFLAEAMVSPLQSVFDKRGGVAAVRNRTSVKNNPTNLAISVSLGRLCDEIIEASYAFEVRAERNYGFEVVREQCVVKMTDNHYYFDRHLKSFKCNLKGLDPSLESNSLVLPLVGGDARFAPVLRTLSGMRVYSIQPAELRRMQDPDGGQVLRTDGGNAASVLLEIERRSPDDFNRIKEFLISIVPNTINVSPIKHGNKLSLEFTQQTHDAKHQKFESYSMSDGTLRALGLLTAVFQHPTPSLIVIEEPEATMHPGAISAIMDLLRHASSLTQLVVTTHSPDILDSDWLEDRHLRIVDWQNGATKLSYVSEGTQKILQDQIQTAGELLRSNALSGRPHNFSDMSRTKLFREYRK